MAGVGLVTVSERRSTTRRSSRSPPPGRVAVIPAIVPAPLRWRFVDLDELLALAMRVVSDVMSTIARARADAATDGRALAQATKSTVTDMVTEMDLWAERHITAALLDARPHDAIVGE